MWFIKSIVRWSSLSFIPCLFDVCIDLFCRHSCPRHNCIFSKLISACQHFHEKLIRCSCFVILRLGSRCANIIQIFIYIKSFSSVMEGFSYLLISLWKHFFPPYWLFHLWISYQMAKRMLSVLLSRSSFLEWRLNLHFSFLIFKISAYFLPSYCPVYC